MLVDEHQQLVELGRVRHLLSVGVSDHRLRHAHHALSPVDYQPQVLARDLLSDVA